MSKPEQKVPSIAFGSGVKAINAAYHRTLELGDQLDKQVGE